MIYIVENIVPILAATLAGLVFGCGLAAVLGAPARRDATTLAVEVLAEFWVAAILAGAVILAPRQADPWIMALGSAVIIWIGFVAPTLVATGRRNGASWSRIACDVGHWLGLMVIQAAVVQAIGVRAPAP